MASARAGKTDWTAHNGFGWFLYDFADVTVISVTKWQTKSSKRGLRGDALLAVLHVEISHIYVDKFDDGGMSGKYAKTVWARLKRLKRDIAVKVEKRQQLLGRRLGTSDTANRQRAKN